MMEKLQHVPEELKQLNSRIDDLQQNHNEAHKKFDRLIENTDRRDNILQRLTDNVIEMLDERISTKINNNFRDLNITFYKILEKVELHICY